MSKYKLLIFDFDGTLCATHDAIINSVTKTFEYYNIQPPMGDSIKSTIGKSLEDAFAILSGGEISRNDKILKEWVIKYREIYSRIWADHTFLFENVKYLLSKFVESGIHIVVISNKGAEAVNSALCHYGIKEYISFIAGDIKGVNKKPDPMPYNKIIKPEFPDVAKKNILMVGDTETDLEFAKNIKVNACWCKYGYGDFEKCMELNPEYSISSFLKLDNIVYGNPE